MVAFLFQSCSGGPSRPLPPVPNVEVQTFLPAIRQQLSEALENARRYPDDPEAVGKLGMSLHAHEQYESAELAYRRAEGLSPATFAWPYYLAMVQQAKGDARAALESVNRALEIDSDNIPALHLKADLLIARSRWDEAEQVLNEVLEKNPVQARALYGIGRVRLGQDRQESAIESFQRACEYFPTYGAAHYALAGAYRRLGDNNQASRHIRAYELYRGIDAPVDDPLWEKVADLNMGPQVHMRRALTFEAKGDLENAAAANEKALELDPTLVQAHVNLVSLYGRLEQIEKAEAHFREGLSQNPNRDDLYYNHGVLMFRENRIRDAKIAFERALAINPYNGQAQTNVGYILQTEGRLKESKAMLEKAVQNSPNSRLAHFHLARILIHFNQLPDGIQHLKLTLTPEDEQTPAFVYALAAAQARAKRTDEALENVYRARDLALKYKQADLLKSIEQDIPKMERAKR